MIEACFRKRWGAFSLEVDLSAGGGLGVFGPSGAGKSTLLACLAGLERPDEGRIALGGEVVFSDGVFVPPHRRAAACVFQEPALFPHLDVAGNLDYARPPRDRPGPSRREVVDLLDLGPLLGRRPLTLSGGEARRVALGRALLSRPRVLLLDEPLAGLDETRRQRVLPYLVRLRQRLDMPLVYVSHVLGEVLALSDHVVVLDQGRQVGLGPPWEALHDPAVLPIALGCGLDNLLVGRVEEVDRAGGLTWVRCCGHRLALPRLEVEAGSEVRATLRADGVVVDPTSAPGGSSARNRVPAQVEAVVECAGRVLVHLEAEGGLRLLAEVTPQAASELGLEPGRRVTAVVKATAMRVLAS